MNGRHVAAVRAVVALVATAGVGSAVAGVGPAADLFGEEERPPALLSFESTGGQCTDDFMANSSTAVSGGANTLITHTQNVSLPDTSYAVGGPTFERLNETAYRLSIPIEETDEEPLDCTAYARYEAQLRIPAGDDPWRVIVEHDGETETTLFGDSDSTGATGSAGAGASVSE